MIIIFPQHNNHDFNHDQELEMDIPSWLLGISAGLTAFIRSFSGLKRRRRRGEGKDPLIITGDWLLLLLLLGVAGGMR